MKNFSRYLFCLIFSLLSFLVLHSQIQYEWVKGYDEFGDLNIIKILTDHNGDLIIGGEFEYEVLHLTQEDSIINMGMRDVFIAKINTSGDIIWKTSIGGINNEYLSDMIIDGEDNIYITGNCSSKMIKVGDVTINSDWSATVYIVKLDPDGNYSHAAQSAEGTWCEPSNIFMDVQTNVYLVGTFYYQLSFGSFNLETNTFTENSFVCKLTSDLSIIWADQFLQDSTNYRDIYVDENENIYLTGSLMKDIYLEPDIYRHKFYFHVTKFDKERKKIWSFIDTTAQYGFYIQSLNDQLLISTKSNIDETGMSLCGTNYRSNNTSALYILDKSGKKVYQNKITGIFIEDMIVDQDDIYITGSLFADELTLGGYQMQRQTDSSGKCNQYPDILIAKFDHSLDPVWSVSYPGGIDDQGKAIAKDSRGYVFIGGIYESWSLDFGDDIIFNTNPLQIFGHVSGIYFDRKINSFLLKGSDDPESIPNISRKGIKIYPVPLQNVLNIEFSENPIENTKIIIYNQAGQMIWQCSFTGNQKVLDVSEMINGFYMIKIIRNKKVYVCKLIK